MNYGDQLERADRLQALQRRIDQVLAEPPFLHPGEEEFLRDLWHWCRTSEPTKPQLSWLEKIERRSPMRA